MTSTPRTRKFRAKQKALKLCMRCNMPLSNHSSECLEKHNNRNNELYHQNKQKVFELYGNACSNCGENQSKFLTIDHVEGKGNKERQKISSRSFMSRLANSTQSSKYQLLCWNCNCSKNSCFRVRSTTSAQDRWYKKLKTEILLHYGGMCECCGETTLMFLTIDHPNGNGSEERKLIGSGSKFFRWLKAEKMPPHYRVLCFNCNCSIGLYGSCPHQSSNSPC